MLFLYYDYVNSCPKPIQRVVVNSRCLYATAKRLSMAGAKRRICHISLASICLVYPHIVIGIQAFVYWPTSLSVHPLCTSEELLCMSMDLLINKRKTSKKFSSRDLLLNFCGTLNSNPKARSSLNWYSTIGDIVSIPSCQSLYSLLISAAQPPKLSLLITAPRKRTRLLHKWNGMMVQLPAYRYLYQWSMFMCPISS